MAQKGSSPPPPPLPPPTPPPPPLHPPYYGGHVYSQHIVFGPASATLVCPVCHEQICTRVDTIPTIKTHLIATILCLLCCPCVWLPYVTDCFKAKNHYCPRCGTFLGTYDM